MFFGELVGKFGEMKMKFFMGLLLMFRAALRGRPSPAETGMCGRPVRPFRAEDA